MIKNNISENANLMKIFLTIGVIYIHSFSLVPAETSNFLYYLKVFLSFVLPRIAVPLFFVYSGYFFFKGNEFNKITYWIKTKRRLSTLVIPYIFWNIVALIVFLVTDERFRANIFNIHDVLTKTFIGNIPDTGLWHCLGYEIPMITPLNTPLWYIRDLFLICLLSPLVYTLIRNKVIGCIFILIGTTIFLFHDTSQIPFIGFDNIYFFSVGAFLSYYPLNIKLRRRYLYIIAMFAFSLSIFTLSFYSTEKEQYFRHAYIVAMSAAILLMPTLKINDNLLNVIGGGKIMFVFCSHCLILKMLVFVTYRLSLFLPSFMNVFLFIISPLICFFICVVLYKVTERIYPKSLSFLLGNR